MLENAMGFASDVVKTRNILNIFPDLLKPCVAYIQTDGCADKRAVQLHWLLAPMGAGPKTQDG